MYGSDTFDPDNIKIEDMEFLADHIEGYLNLFKDYNFKIEIIFLETEYNENLERDKQRKKSVGLAVINELLSKIDIPEVDEAEIIKWECI